MAGLRGHGATIFPAALIKFSAIAVAPFLWFRRRETRRGLLVGAAIAGAFTLYGVDQNDPIVDTARKTAYDYVELNLESQPGDTPERVFEAQATATARRVAKMLSLPVMATPKEAKTAATGKPARESPAAERPPTD